MASTAASPPRPVSASPPGSPVTTSPTRPAASPQPPASAASASTSGSAAASSSSSGAAVPASQQRESTFLELCDRLNLPRAIADPLNQVVNSVYFFNAAEAAFEEADSDKSGYLERKEYRGVAQAILSKFKDHLPFHDTAVSDEDVDAVISAFDTNKDDRIDPTELYMVAKMLILLRTYQDWKFKQANRPEICHLRVEGVIEAPVDAVWERAGDFYDVSYVPSIISCERLMSGERKVSFGDRSNPTVCYEKQEPPMPKTEQDPWKKGYGYTITNDPDPKIQPGSFKGNLLLFDAPGGKTKIAVVLSWVSSNSEDAAAVKAHYTKYFSDAIENVRRLFRRS